MHRLNIRVFWRRVKRILKERAATQDEAARAMGVAAHTFRTWMSRGRIPPLSYVYMLAQFLEVSVDYLINGQTDRAAKINAEVIAMLKKVSSKLKSI